MSQFDFEILSSAQYARLVTFTWGGSPSVLRYTDWTDNIIVSKNTFTSLPEMEVEIGKLTLTLEDEDSSIVMPVTAAPADRLSRVPFRGDIEVLIQDLDPADTSEIRTLYRGHVRSTIKNYDGNPGVVQILIESLKAKLAVQAGLIISRTDNNYWLGHTANGVTLSGVQITGTLTAIGVDGVPTRVTLSFGGSPDLSNELWAFGYMEALGERLGIRKSLEDGDFDLDAVPDTSWIGETITLTQGWDGSIESARNNYAGESLESRFCGLGLFTPDRNPLFQSESQS